MTINGAGIRGRNKSRRTGFLLALDGVMFLLVCVLEALSLTGLTWHEWLGFVLCPLVLLHVVLQWQWVVTQVQRLAAPGAYRARANFLLNVLLLILMAAVLVSGVLISTQITPLAGDHFGRNQVWHEIHGWLNFSLVVAVALHVALNWDWIVAVLRRRAVERPALAEMPRRTDAVSPRRGRSFVQMALAGRGGFCGWRRSRLGGGMYPGDGGDAETRRRKKAEAAKLG